jgi:multidrug efflux system membrane fusion protein
MRRRLDPCRAALLGPCAAVLITLFPPLLAATASEGTVTLSPSSVNASGIQTALLKKDAQIPRTKAVATVLDIRPLLTLAAQLQSSKVQADAAALAASAATAEATRSRRLYQQDQNASLRHMQAAAAAAAQAHAQQVAASAQAMAVRSNASVRWGSSLTRTIESGPQALSAFVDGQRALLSVVMSSGSAAPATDSLQLELPDGSTASAHLIGPSPQADAIVQGPSYFYRVDGADLRADQRLTALVPQERHASTGVAVPAAAVIWYAGQPWAYIETTPGHYERRPLAQNTQQPGDWFQTHGFEAGERVVVRGAELLLSEELKPPPGTAPVGDGDDG